MVTSCYDDSELRERIEKLENTTAVVINQQITALQSSIDALKSVDFELKNQIAALETTDTSHQNEIDALKEKDEELLKMIEELQAGIDSLRAWVEDILKNYSTTEEMNEQFAAVQEQINKLNVQVAMLLATPDILFDVDGSVAYSPGTMVEIKYTLVNTDETTEMEYIADEGWKAIITPAKDRKSGTISVTTPITGGEGKILVFVSTKQNTAMRVLRFEQGTLTVLTNSIVVEPQDTLLTIDACTNLDYRVAIPADAKLWIELLGIDTRATMRKDYITLAVKSNPASQSRFAVISLVDTNDQELSSITIYQRAEAQLNNEIWYTSTDGNIVEPMYSNVFGRANIVSNTCSKGKGVIAFDRDLTTIGNEAFGCCEKLKTISIPNSVTSIGENAFYYSGLTSIAIPSSITSIPEACFMGCFNLTSVTIPESIKSMGIWAFMDCESLDAVYINDLQSWCEIDILEPSPENDYGCATNPLQYAHKLFLNGKLIKDLIIPMGITKVKSYAFTGCSSLVSVTIPESVISIGKESFKGCSSLTSVTFSESVTSIDSWAFSNCSSLTSVICLRPTPPSISEWKPFPDDVANHCTLFVPAGCVDVYATSEGWNNFKEIKEIE